MNRLVLLDRDGTINVDKHYLSSPDELKLLPHAAEGIRILNDLELIVVIATNQSAIGRGLFSEDRLASIHERLLQMLRTEGARIDGLYYCLHRPDEGCDCRKPKPGLAHKAAQEWNADLTRSFVIGDKACDVELGRSIGALTFLVPAGDETEAAQARLTNPDFAVQDLKAAAEIIGIRVT